jgi:hypothetical protein
MRNLHLEQWRENDENAVDGAQKEVAELPADQPNQLTKSGHSAEQREERVSLESYDPQDSASHAYYAHADVQHIGCCEKT